MDIPYTGKFTVAQLEPVLKAAAPIPPGLIAWEKIGALEETTADSRGVTCAEAIVRRLEMIAVYIRVINPHDPQEALSRLSKRYHAIVAATDTLLTALGTDSSGDPAKMPHQIHNIFCWIANSYGEKTGGFPNHLPAKPKTDGFIDYKGEAQLRQNIQGIVEIRLWAHEAETRTKARIAKKGTEIHLSDLPIVESGGYDPINETLKEIMWVWGEILERDVTTSWNDYTKEAGGPLIDFSRACLNALGLDTSDLSQNAIRNRIRRLRAG